MSILTPPYIAVLLYYKLISILVNSNIIFAGEYNSGVGKNTTIRPDQHLQYVKKFLDFSYHGAAFWWWSFEHDCSHPSFNLNNVVKDRIQPNKNFENFVESLKMTTKKK